MDLQLSVIPRFHMHSRGRLIQNSFLKFVAVALHREDHVMAVECAIVDRGDSVAVRPEPDGVA